MRAVHAYINLGDKDEDLYSREFDNLLWKFSAWTCKKLGFTTVLYVHPKDKKALETIDILKYYDEVHFVTSDKFDKVDRHVMWAAWKFVGLEEEIKRQPAEEFFMLDIDLVIMTDWAAKMLDVKNDVMFWMKEDIVKFNYVPFREIITPSGFIFPKYFDSHIQPSNTAIIRIPVLYYYIYKEWLRLVWGCMINNPAKNVDRIALMCSIEQRFITNVTVGKYGIHPKHFCCKENPDFGDGHFHVWGWKWWIKSKPDIRDAWIKGMLLLFKKYNREEYEHLIEISGPQVKNVIKHWKKIKCPEQLNPYLKPKKYDKDNCLLK